MIPEFFPLLEKKDEIQKLWTGFYTLIEHINKEDCNPEEVGFKTKAWVTSFTAVYQAKDVTPYMHAFTMHVPEMLELHGNIVTFTQQGLEKLNDITTKQFQRSTNHQELLSLRQILEKRNRIELLEDRGYERNKMSKSVANADYQGITNGHVQNNSAGFMQHLKCKVHINIQI